MTGLRDGEANGDGKLRDLGGAAQQRGKIRGKRVLLTGYAGARNEIEKAGRAGGGCFEAVGGGGGSAKENGVEVMRGKDAAVVAGFFRSEIGDEDTVGASRRSSGGKFFEAHLKDGIVVAEKEQRHFRRLPNATNEIEHSGERRTGFEGAFRGALNGRAIGERIAEGYAKLDDVRAGFGEREDKLPRGIQGRIARGDIRDDAEFAGGTELGETFGNTGRVGGSSGHIKCDREAVNVCGERLEQTGISVHVLVAAAGEVEDDEVVVAHAREPFDQPCDGVRGFERGTK